MWVPDAGLSPVANKPRNWSTKVKHNGTRALRKFPDARNITLQCNVIFSIDPNIPHYPKYTNRNNNKQLTDIQIKLIILNQKQINLGVGWTGAILCLIMLNSFILVIP
jgi:hypothetical protein